MEHLGPWNKRYWESRVPSCKAGGKMGSWLGQGGR